MKNRFFILLLAAVLIISAGCSPALHPTNTDTEPPTEPPTSTPTTDAPTEPPTEPPTEAPTEPTAPPIHPDTVGIYIPAEDGTRNRKRIGEFIAKRTAKTDIDCFEILASHNSVVEGSSYKTMWKNAWNSQGEFSDAKIGFYISFQLDDGTEISQTVLKPSDAAWFYDYLEIYLYDDIHQTGWYSHLEDSDIQENTVISSIKLTSGSKISHVGTIFLTAFIYNSTDNFDETGMYIGNVSETIAIFDK